MAKHKHKRQHHRDQAVAKGAAGAALSDTIRSGGFRFAAVFALSCIGLYGLVQVLPSSVLSPINEHVARMLGLLLNALGITASVAGDIVSEKALAFRIIPECTPIFTAGLFFCFVVFYPATVREKATGFLMGIPALYLGNLVRLAATFMISRYNRGFFEVVHVYLGQVFTILLVIVACIVWVKWLDRKESPWSVPMKVIGFLIRFSLISGCLFLVWLKVHHWYIWSLDRFILFGFSLFNYRVPLVRQTVYYYETFSIVVFISLVLAAWSLPWKTKIKALAVGLGFLFFIHLIHRINNVLLAYFNFATLVPVDLTLLVVGQYLLPVLFVIYLVRLQRQTVPSVG
ncbi:MAG TPA: exosortase H [Thermodesulfobacteriota bacterium]|nr:exosortase H [Thermodesulfobacteriota bacterium]